MAYIHEWAGQIRAYNRNVKLSFLLNIVTQIGLGMFMVIYNFYIRRLGYSDSVNGKVISMGSLATAIALVPAGLVSDRLGRKKIIFIGILLSGFILVSRSIFSEQHLLVTTAFIGGLVMAFIQVSSLPWLAENSTPEQRVHLFSLYYAMMTAASVVGNLLGGVLTDLFSLFTSELGSIRITLLIGSFIFLFGTIPAAKFHENTKKSGKGKKNKLSRKWNWKDEGLKIIILFAIANILIGFGSGLVIPYLNLYFADRFYASTSSIGIIISLGQAATAVAMFIGPFFVNKVGEVKAVVLLQLFSLPFLLLTAYTKFLWVAVLGFLFRQALMNAGNPIQMSLMMAKVNDSMKGLANSISQMIFNLGWAIMGPVSTGIVVKYGSYWGYSYVFSITATLYFIGSIYFYIFFKGFSISKRKSPSDKTV
ncbi:MAG: MFS transporter [Bacillota bacterium]|nr:MFS transporter [Bacillota bacterium]